MTFENLYKSVVSILNLQGEEVRFYDIMTAINDAYVQARDLAVTSGTGSYFSVTDDVFVTIKDFSYGEFYYAELSKDVCSTLPIQQAVLSTLVELVNTKIKNGTDTKTAGTQAVKDGKVYVCTHDFTATNTFNLTFDSKDVRNYRDGNGLTYKAGEIVKDTTTGFYWKVANDFIATTGTTDFESRLYWKYVKDNYATANVYPYYDFTRNRLYDNIEDVASFSIYKNLFYTKKPQTKATITYIPEWDYVYDLDTEIQLPKAFIPKIRSLTLQQVTLKVRGRSGSTDN